MWGGRYLSLVHAVQQRTEKNSVSAKHTTKKVHTGQFVPLSTPHSPPMTLVEKASMSKQLPPCMAIMVRPSLLSSRPTPGLVDHEGDGDSWQCHAAKEKDGEGQPDSIVGFVRRA